METTITVEEELQEYIVRLNLSQKKLLLELMKAFVEKDEMKPQTIEEYNKELEDAVAEVEAGNFYMHEEVKEMMKNW